MVQRSLSRSFACIVANSGRDSAAAVAKVAKASNGHGFDARSGETADMVKAGIIDPVKVSYCAVRNAGSVAAWILTTQTLTAKKSDDYDVTACPARGGGLSFLDALEAGPPGDGVRLFGVRRFGSTSRKMFAGGSGHGAAM